MTHPYRAMIHGAEGCGVQLGIFHPLDFHLGPLNPCLLGASLSQIFDVTSDYKGAFNGQM